MTVFSLFLVAAVAAIPAPERSDTIISVDRGDVLEISNLFGQIRVRGWERDEVSLEVDDDPGVEVDVLRVGIRVSMSRGDVRRRERRASYTISVPVWMDVSVDARELDIEVRGTRGDLLLETIDGDILLADVRGSVAASSAEGTIEVGGGDGTFTLATLDDDVMVSNLAGAVAIHATDGEIIMRDMSAHSVTANTVDGSIEFEGRILDGGDLRLTTHDGDVSVDVIGDIDAVFSVSTYTGDFESEFPIQLNWLDSGRGLEFTLGEGSARIVLSAFDGDVMLNRARRR